MTAVNLVDTLTSPAGRVWDSDYNTRELLETFQEPSLDTSIFQYFDDQRLKQMTDPVGILIYGYDTKARLDTVTEGAAVIDRDYDALDRLIKFTDSAGNVIEYTYDGAGNLRTIEYPGGKTVTSTYDSADRLDFVTDWNGRVTDFQYNARSQLAAIVFPNGTRRILTYDTAGRVASMRDETSALEVISQFGFGYDILSRIQQETATPEADFTILPAIMAYDDDDRLVTWNGQPCASDPDGNLTSGPLQGSIATLGYDARNRLTSAGGATYTYDAENRRTSQTTGGVTTSYIHDPQDTLSHLLMRTTGTTTTYYVYAAGMLLYEETDGATKTHHYDYRGSTVAITDDSETVTDRIFYGPYGETVARTGTTDTPFLFHGAYGVETDSNGLICMRARYYNPETRRFLNADPLGFDAGINWYAFVSGNSIMSTDPMGLLEAIAAHEYWMDAAANGITKGGISGYAQATGATAMMTAIDFWGARTLESNAEKSGNAAGRGCDGEALGYGALAVGQIALSAAGSVGVNNFVHPFYRFIGPGSRAGFGTGTWLVRGTVGSIPYGTVANAATKLQIPTQSAVNTAVRAENVWWRWIAGPRRASGNPQWGAGGGLEYRVGGF